MTTNPILEELYAARDKLLADAGGDIHRFLEGVREREAASGLLLPAGRPSLVHAGGEAQETSSRASINMESHTYNKVS